MQCCCCCCGVNTTLTWWCGLGECALLWLMLLKHPKPHCSLLLVTDKEVCVLLWVPPVSEPCTQYGTCTRKCVCLRVCVIMTVSVSTSLFVQVITGATVYLLGQQTTPDERKDFTRTYIKTLWVTPQTQRGHLCYTGRVFHMYMSEKRRKKHIKLGCSPDSSAHKVYTSLFISIEKSNFTVNLNLNV